MNRSNLVSTLELVGRALAANNQVPIYECFCFNGKNVYAFNDELGIIAPCDVAEPFAVNGSVLLGLLKNSHSEEVDFTIDDQHDVVIKAGKSRFRMPYSTKEDFLFTPPKLKAPLVIDIDEKFIKGLEACLITTSHDDDKRAFQGVCLEQGKKYLTMYSSDGDAITRFVTEYKDTNALSYFMPISFCESIIKIIQDTKSDKSNLHLTNEWVRATVEGFDIYGRLLERNSVLDYEAEISKTLKGTPTYIGLPRGFDHALSRARVIADAESAKTTLTVKDGKLSLYTETHAGIVRDSVPFGKHNDVEADVSAELVQRAIGLCDEMALTEDCTVYKNGTELFLIISNMG